MIIKYLIFVIVLSIFTPVAFAGGDIEMNLINQKDIELHLEIVWDMPENEDRLKCALSTFVQWKTTKNGITQTPYDKAYFVNKNIDKLHDWVPIIYRIGLDNSSVACTDGIFFSLSNELKKLYPPEKEAYTIIINNIVTTTTMYEQVNTPANYADMLPVYNLRILDFETTSSNFEFSFTVQPTNSDITLQYSRNLTIITDKESVEPGDTLITTCVKDDNFDPAYSWYVTISKTLPTRMSTFTPLARAHNEQPLTYSIPLGLDINKIVLTCWITSLTFNDNGFHEHGEGIHKVLSWAIPNSNDNTTVKKKGNGGCADCTPPTLGLDKSYKRVVDNGFSYNGQTVQVEKWYTEFPLINATVGVPNLVEIKVYENHGINNMKWVQFCLGAEEKGQPLDSCEVLIEVHLLTNGTTTGIMVDNIVINDNDNLIDNDSVSAVSYVVPCMDNSLSSNCVKVDLQYTYREETINHMMIINVADKARNAQNFHLNEGVNVLGESLNEPPSITLFNKQTSQQKDDLWITYTRTDKRTDTWFDESGIEYHRINDVTFDRITPQEPYHCNDPPVEKIKVWKRTNCHFRALTGLWN